MTNPTNYAKQWVKDCLAKDVDFVKFQINQRILEIPKEFVYNDRANTTLMQFIIKTKQKEIVSGKAIELRGGKREEKDFRLYLDFLKGNTFIENHLTLKKISRKVACLLQFGIGLLTSFELYGITTEQEKYVVVGYFLSLMSQKLLHLVMIMDLERKWKSLMFQSIFVAAFSYREHIISNMKNIEELCHFYDIEEVIQLSLAELSEKDLHPKQMIDIREVYNPTKLNDVKLRLGNNRTVSNLASSIPKTASKIGEISGDALKKLCVIQLGIKSWLVRSKYTFKTLYNRRMKFKEWYDTEYNLCENMKMVDVYFKQPMINAINSKTLNEFTQKDVTNLFLTLDSCIESSTQMTKYLNPLFSQTTKVPYDLCIGDHVIKLKNYLYPFLPYTTDFNIAKSVLDRLKATDAGGEFLRNCENRLTAETNKYCSLNDLLIQPAQRVMRYPLLLSDLMKNTRPRHPDQIALANAFNCYQFFTAIVADDELFARGRYLYSEASVTFKKKKQIAFLFNDKIWIVKETSIKENKESNKPKKIKPDSEIIISADTTVMLSSSVLNIVNGNETIFLLFDNQNTSKQWSDEINKIVAYGLYNLDDDESWLKQFEDENPHYK
ncbi:Rho/RAC guanine nucleotide exchange factor [Entamoeba marina]